MFKSKKVDEPTPIQSAEIEEDMMSFKTNTVSNNNSTRQHIIDDIKASIDMKTNTIAADADFWRHLKFFDAQMIEMEESASKIKGYREELELKSDKIRNERIMLQMKLEQGLNDIRKMKSPV